MLARHSSSATAFLLVLVSLPSTVHAKFCIGTQTSSSPDIDECSRINGDLIIDTEGDVALPNLEYIFLSTEPGGNLIIQNPLTTSVSFPKLKHVAQNLQIGALVAQSDDEFNQDYYDHMRRRDEFYDTLNSTASYGGHSYGGQENNYYDGSYDPSIGTRRSLQAAPGQANEALQHVSFPSLEYVGKTISILNSPNLLSVTFGKLRNVNGDWTVKAPESLGCLTIPSLTDSTVGGKFDLYFPSVSACSGTSGYDEECVSAVRCPATQLLV